MANDQTEETPSAIDVIQQLLSASKQCTDDADWLPPELQAAHKAAEALVCRMQSVRTYSPEGLAEECVDHVTCLQGIMGARGVADLYEMPDGEMVLVYSDWDDCAAPNALHDVVFRVQGCWPSRRG